MGIRFEVIYFGVVFFVENADFRENIGCWMIRKQGKKF